MMYTILRRTTAAVLLVGLVMQGGLGFGLHALDAFGWGAERSECHCHDIHNEVSVSDHHDCQICKYLAVNKPNLKPAQVCLVTHPNLDQGISTPGIFAVQEIYFPTYARGPPV